MQQRLLWLILLLILLTQPVVARQAAADERSFIACGNAGAVSCGHPLATAAALEVLREGGNAIDAAVCAGFMLGVVDFTNSGLGGDGFALVHLPDGRITAWDAAVKRPRHAASKEITSHIGLPTVADLLLRLRRLYGRRQLAQLVQPAIQAAQAGFKVSAYLEKTIEKTLPALTDQAAISFLAPQGYPLRAGQILRQPLLASTLKQIASDDGRSFYRGSIAKALIASMRAHGSEYELTDLAMFRSQAVKPVRRSWQSYVIYGNPPPASSIASIKLAEDLLNSGIHLYSQQAGDVLATAALGRKILQTKYSYLSHCLHDPYKFIEFADKAEFADSSAALEDGNTTHLCVIDQDGMAVSMTLTVGSHFGSGQYSPAGFFYNNGLRNFTDTVSGYPEDYPDRAGPISAKSPVLVTRNGKLLLAIGGAGSDRIVFNTGLALARVLQKPQDIDQLTTLPRYFLDYRQKLFVEWQPDKTLLDQLKQSGSDVTIRPGCDDYFGLLSAIIAENGQYKALADQRRDGSCAAFDKISP
ncbi:MAG: hypothetical protein CVV41_15065 [Candidatus Riflebacteria bacterium HGW-Riflebacteria-1]|nr:MAG: hypothetical protein CVV41_15065 [Candidatus Riflebacteria bacterium HGW-Riflebacteria-1]